MQSRYWSGMAAVAFALLLGACGGKPIEERLADGQRAYDAGNMRAALLEAREALQAEPGNAEARLLRALGTMAVGDFGTAEADFNRALASGLRDRRVVAGLAQLHLLRNEPAETLAVLQSNQDLVDAELSLGVLQVEALVASGEVSRAESELARLVAAFGADDDPKVALRQTQILLAKGEVPAAAERAEQLRGAVPEMAQAWSVSGGIAQTQGRYADAAEFYGEAAARWAAQGRRYREIDARYRVALNTLESGDDAAAEASVAAFERVSPDSPPANFLRGSMMLKQGNLAAANTLLREANSKAPGNLQYLRLLGLSELGLGNLGQAEQHLRMVLRGAPDDIVAQNAMADIAMRQGRTDDAIRILTEMAGTGPSYTARLGQALLLDGQIDEAIALLEGFSAGEQPSQTIRLLLARAYAERGDMSSAESMLADAVDADANDYTAALSLIRTYMAQGDNASAEALTEALLADRSEDPRAYAAASWFLYSIGRSEDALARAREAVARFPESTIAHSLLGNLSVASDDLETGDASLTRVLELDPGNVGALLDLARLRSLQERPDDAMQLLEQADSLTDSDFRPAQALTRMSLRAGRSEAALRWSDRLVDLAPNRAQALGLRAAVLSAAGQRESAIAMMTRAVQQSDANPGMFQTLARLQAGTGDTRAAENTLERALNRFPGSQMLRAEQALLALSRGRVGLADKAADALLVDAPDQPTALLIKGEINLRGGDFSAAREFYDRAERAGAGAPAVLGRHAVANRLGQSNAIQILRDGHERYPDAQVLTLVLAQSEQLGGDRRRAAGLYRQVLERAPENPVALNNLAWMMNEDGDIDEAWRLVQRAVEASPDAPDVLDTYGLVQLARGDVDGAVSSLERAVSLNAENPEIRYHLAQALAEAGDEAAAIGQLRQVLSGDSPERVLADARQLLTTLEQQ